MNLCESIFNWESSIFYFLFKCQFFIPHLKFIMEARKEMEQYIFDSHHKKRWDKEMKSPLNFVLSLLILKSYHRRSMEIFGLLRSNSQLWASPLLRWCLWIIEWHSAKLKVISIQSRQLLKCISLTLKRCTVLAPTKCCNDTSKWI